MGETLQQRLMDWAHRLDSSNNWSAWRFVRKMWDNREDKDGPLELDDSDIPEIVGVVKEAADTIEALREAMHTAVLKIEDGAASHARGVLLDALAESEDSEQEVDDE